MLLRYNRNIQYHWESLVRKWSSPVAYMDHLMEYTKCLRIMTMAQVIGIAAVNTNDSVRCERFDIYAETKDSYHSYHLKRHSSLGYSHIECISYPMIYINPVLRNRTICHARDLWKLPWSCKQLRLLCPPTLWKLPDTALISGFQSSQGVKQCLVNVLLFGMKEKSEIYIKLKSNLYVWPVNIFPVFLLWREYKFQLVNTVSEHDIILET